MKILCFQHHDDEHAGYLRQLLARDGHTLTVVMLHRGDPIPHVDAFDALWVLGGPMDVWQQAEHPWLKAELVAIEHAVSTLKMPYLGLCLGHQLLAVALGGHVAAGTPEIGVLAVDLTASGRDSDFLSGAPDSFHALQWHSAEVVEAPTGANVLAASPVCAVQAMSVGAHALSFQFHLEAEWDTVSTWGAVPEYRTALLNALGDEGADLLERDCDAALDDMNRLCERLYANWQGAVVNRAEVSA